MHQQVNNNKRNDPNSNTSKRIPNTYKDNFKEKEIQKQTMAQIITYTHSKPNWNDNKEKKKTWQILKEQKQKHKFLKPNY